MEPSPRLIVAPLGALYRFLAPITELLVRVVAGGSLAIHGYQILFGGVQAAAGFLGGLGWSAPLFWAYAVGAVEFGCGLCLALGLFTRAVAVPIIVFLATAIVTYHWQFGFNWESRGIEYPLFWSIVVLHFLMRGGGPWSLDRLIGREL